MLGWGGLVAAAGVSLYFAKKTINDRRMKQETYGQRPSNKLDRACVFLSLLCEVMRQLDFFHDATQGARGSSSRRPRRKALRLVGRRVWTQGLEILAEDRHDMSDTTRCLRTPLFRLAFRTSRVAPATALHELQTATAGVSLD
ncbi:hypothetical protein OH76DRAFT_1018943 [Lentinus brumalis]|uniref:Uncharacterized protein n=1 Tax=Lentinus brumalis TaxID=2498619 RepID=A0A371CY66_9APHY|nr:hypothetical protein OH76DRAFT_1018943 [Polyporus brumalis]